MSPKLSASSTQEESHAFVQRSDDEEELWEVIEITKEKATMFKVRWKGDDPETGKPWAQSWVPKSDVTDDLKKDWKRRQKAKASRSKFALSPIRSMVLIAIWMQSSEIETVPEPENLSFILYYYRTEAKRALVESLSFWSSSVGKQECLKINQEDADL